MQVQTIGSYFILIAKYYKKLPIKGAANIKGFTSIPGTCKSFSFNNYTNVLIQTQSRCNIKIMACLVPSNRILPEIMFCFKTNTRTNIINPLILWNVHSFQQQMEQNDFLDNTQYVVNSVMRMLYQKKIEKTAKLIRPT